MLNLYVDESSQNAHRFIVLGCTIVPSDCVSEIHRRIAELRVEQQIGREVKWTKVSRAKLDAYVALVDIYFSFQSDFGLQFHSLIVDATRLNHAKFNQGDREIGSNKFVYQLLLKAGERRSQSTPFYVYLDSRKTRHGLDELHSVLNNGFSKGASAPLRPYHRVQFRDSKEVDLLQLNDLILGAIAFYKNAHNLAPNCSPSKLTLAEYIAVKAKVRDLCADTSFARNDFRVWNFRLR